MYTYTNDDDLKVIEYHLLHKKIYKDMIIIQKFKKSSTAKNQLIFLERYIKNNVTPKSFYWTAGHEKLRTCVRDMLEIMNFTNCRIWLFFNRYTLEHTFSVSWVREAFLASLNLIIVSNVSLQLSCLLSFSYPPL